MILAKGRRIRIGDVSKTKPTLYYYLIFQCSLFCENIITKTIMSTNTYSKKQLYIYELFHVIIFGGEKYQRDVLSTLSCCKEDKV